MPSFLNRGFRSPLLPYGLVIALLPFARSAESGTLLCTVAVLILAARHRTALAAVPGVRLALWLLAAYIGAALLSVPSAVRPARSLLETAGLLRYLPLMLYAAWVIRKRSQLHALYTALAVVVALWALDAWVQMLTGWSLGGRAEAERISGIFGADNLKLGPVLAVLSPFLLWAARVRWGRCALILAFLTLLVPILLAGSRAAWLMYVVVGLAFAWRETASPTRFLALCAAGALALAVVVAVAWHTSSRFDGRVQRTLAVWQGTGQGLDTALSGRLEIWRASLRMVAAHPFTGVGVRGFRYAYPQVAPPGDHFLVAEACGVNQGACHAHQWVLEVLAETGVIGLALWVAAAVWAWRAWRRTGSAARERAFPATLALGAMLFPLNTHLAFYSAWWGLLFAWLLGLWCAALYVEHDHAA